MKYIQNVSNFIKNSISVYSLFFKVTIVGFSQRSDYFGIKNTKVENTEFAKLTRSLFPFFFLFPYVYPLSWILIENQPGKKHLQFLWKQLPQKHFTKCTTIFGEICHHPRLISFHGLLDIATLFLLSNKISCCHKNILLRYTFFYCRCFHREVFVRLVEASNISSS